MFIIRTYCLRMGHQATGADKAAEGIVREFDIIREYAPYVISGLKRLGHTVIDVTPPENNLSLYDSLMYGIDKSNYMVADYFISLHANCFDADTAHGCEALYQSSKGMELASRITSELSKLGFFNRGPKLNERGLAELKKTNAVAVIVEPMFISSPTDVELYKKIGPEKIAYAIVKGITGKDVIEPPTTYAPKVEPVHKTNDAIVALKYNLNIDYNAKLSLNDTINDDLIAALKGIQDIICKGHRSNVVKWIQQKLIGYGYMKDGQDTGVYDAVTFNAVTDMQSKWERPTDGVLRLETWKIFLEN